MLPPPGDLPGSRDQFADVRAGGPAHLDALRDAAEAAEGLGQPLRAGAYGLRYQALAAGTAPNSAHLLPPPAEEELRRPRFFDPAEVLGEPSRIPVTREEGPDDEEFTAERHEITLADVGGLEEVKRRL